MPILSTSNTPSDSIEGKQWIEMFRTFLFKIYIFLWVLTTTLRQCQLHCPSSWLSQSKYRQLNVWTFILVSTYFVLVNEIPLWRFKVSETTCKICFPILSGQYWPILVKNYKTNCFSWTCCKVQPSPSNRVPTKDKMEQIKDKIRKIYLTPFLQHLSEFAQTGEKPK